MKNIRRVLCVASVVAFSLTAPRRAAADDWQNYQHDLQHTGRSSAAFDPRSLALAWSAPTGFSSPLIVGDRVIGMRNGGGSGTLTVINSFSLTDGSVNWSYSGQYIFPSAPAYGDGLVVFAATVQSTFQSSLFVLDAQTGSLKYTVPLQDAFLASPVLSRDPASGQTVAYLATNGVLSALQLGATSATTLWTQGGSFGGFSIPTLVGNSLILAGPGQYSSFDRATGVPNRFHAGGIDGGGGVTVAADAARNQFYVLEAFDIGIEGLTAYRSENNGTITQIWQKTGNGFTIGGSVAIGAAGEVYITSGDLLQVLDPTSGSVLRSLGGQNFAGATAPVLSTGYLWSYSENETLAYDLRDLSIARALPGSRGSNNSPFDGPGALADSHFILDYGRIVDRPGFDVYAAPIPEPASCLHGLALALVCGGRYLKRRRRVHRPNGAAGLPNAGAELGVLPA